MVISTELLEANKQRLLNDYNARIEDVKELQTILLEDILSSLVDELELTPEAAQWAEEWLKDTSTFIIQSARVSTNPLYVSDTLFRIARVCLILASDKSKLFTVFAK
jgi:hypothetical protein